jgi:hypothetical protein
MQVMLTRKEKGQRNFGPITPGFNQQRHRNIWFTTGAAIIFITIIVAVSLGIWSLIN